MNQTMLNLTLDTDSFSGISQARLRKKFHNETMRDKRNSTLQKQGPLLIPKEMGVTT